MKKGKRVLGESCFVFGVFDLFADKVESLEEVIG
jgi:hypothetical protein